MMVDDVVMDEYGIGRVVSVDDKAVLVSWSAIHSSIYFLHLGPLPPLAYGPIRESVWNFDESRLEWL